MEKERKIKLIINMPENAVQKWLLKILSGRGDKSIYHIHYPGVVDFIPCV